MGPDLRSPRSSGKRPARPELRKRSLTTYGGRVRGAGDTLSVRERFAFYRRRRGGIHAVLGGLGGRSEARPGDIERGEREI